MTRMKLELENKVTQMSKEVFTLQQELVGVHNSKTS